MFRRNKFKEGGVYVRLRPIAAVSRLLGIFPLAGVLRRDGRLLSRIPYIKRVGISTSKYLAIVHPSHIWDFSLILTLIINICSIFLRVDLVPTDKMTQNSDRYSLEREEYPGAISITSHQNLLKKLPGITFKQLCRSDWKWLKTSMPDKLPDSFSSRTSFLKDTPNSYFSRIPQNIRMVLPGVGNGLESAVSLGKLSIHAYRPEEKRTVGMRGSRLHRSSSPSKVISDGPSSYHKLARRSLIDDGHPRLTGVLPVIWGTLPLDPSKKPLGWENGQYLKSVLIKMIYNNLSTNELSHISQLTSTNEPYKKHSESRRNPGATSVLMQKLSFNSIKQSAPRILKNFGKIFAPRSFSLLNRGHKVYRDMVTGFPRSASKRDISDMWRGSSGGLERFSSSPNVTHKKSTKLIKSASMGFTFMGVICQALLFVVARLNAGRSACLIALMEDLSDALRLLESESRTHRNKSRSHIPRNQRETIYITRGMTRIPQAVIEEEKPNVITKKCDGYYESNGSTNISTASFSVEGSSLASKNRVNIKRFLMKENSHLAKNEKDFKLYPAAKIVHESFSVGNGIKITERKVKGPIFRQPKYFIGSRGRSTKNRMIRQKSRKLNHGERFPIEGCKKDSKRFWKETFKWGSVAKHVSSNDGGVDYGMASGLRKTFRKEEMRKFQSYRGRRNAHISFSTVSMVGYVILLSWLLIFYTRFFVIGDPPFPPFEKSSAMAIPPEDDLQPVIEPQLHDSASSNVLEVTDRDYGQHTSGTKRASTRQTGHRMILEIHLTNRTSMAEARVTTLRNNRGEQLESGSIDVRDSTVHRNADEILFDTPKKSVNEIQDNKSSVILTYYTRVRPQVFLWIASATITSSYFYLHIVQILFFLFEACALFERVNFLVTKELEQYIGISEEGTGSNHRKGCIRHLIGASWGLRRKIIGCTNCKLHSRLETLRLLRSAICSLIMGMETRQVVNAHRRGMDLRKNNFRWNSFSPIFKNNYGRVSFIGTSGSSLLDPRTGLATASEAPTQHRMTRERKGKLQALMCFRQKVRAGKPRLWTKPLKKRKSLDMQAPAGGSRKHTDLPGNGDINGKKISSFWKEQVNVFEKKNSVSPTLSMGILLSPNSTNMKDKKNRLAASMNSIPPPKSGMCSRKGNFREIPTNGEWLKELCDKFVALRGRKCIRKKPISYNRSPRVKMTTKNCITQIHTLSTEVPSDGMNQQVANNAGWQNLCNLKSSWIDKNDVNVIDTEKKSKCFSQPCPCENLFSCGRVLGINGCQGTIILFLTMKSLVDVLLAFTVSIARGYMSGWQIPLQLFRIIGMATVALAATSLSEKARAGIWTMNAVRLEDMDEKSASQLNQLIVQLTASPVEVTASGYFSLTKGFLISIMSVIATYVIIIIQFKLSEA